LEVVGEVYTMLPLLLLPLLAAGVDDDAVPGLEVGVGVPSLELGEDVERGLRLLLLLLTIGLEEDAVPELEVREMAPGLDVSEEVELELILLLLVTGPEDDRVTEGDVDGVEYVLLLVLLPLSPPLLIVVLALDAEELL
jgi:hypothetical protein